MSMLNHAVIAAHSKCVYTLMTNVAATAMRMECNLQSPRIAGISEMGNLCAESRQGDARQLSLAETYAPSENETAPGPDLRHRAEVNHEAS